MNSIIQFCIIHLFIKRQISVYQIIRYFCSFEIQECLVIFEYKIVNLNFSQILEEH